MKLLLPYPHTSLHPLARLRAWHRLLAAGLTGAIVALLTQSLFWETWLLSGWLASCLVYLVIVWWGVGRLDATQTRLRASSLDPGSTALYILIIVISWVSLVGVLLVTDSAKTQLGLGRWLHIGLALATLGTSWLLIQTVFALRYARRYYSENTRGLIFPGTADPTYLEFAYFAAVIGMTSQVADVAIAHSTMRRMVLLHGLVSFGFNLMVLALTLNLVASALG
ncbi:MAG: DUF1345 domain-containing protein [Thiobacillus sp.]